MPSTHSTEEGALLYRSLSYGELRAIEDVEPHVALPRVNAAARDRKAEEPLEAKRALRVLPEEITHPPKAVFYGWHLLVLSALCLLGVAAAGRFLQAVPTRALLGIELIWHAGALFVFSAAWLFLQRPITYVRGSRWAKSRPREAQNLKEKVAERAPHIFRIACCPAAGIEGYVVGEISVPQTSGSSAPDRSRNEKRGEGKREQQPAKP